MCFIISNVEYLTAKKAAEKLGVSAGRIRQLVVEKRLPATKFGNSLMILESDLELVRERKKTGRPPKIKNTNKTK